jgi:hypothetical protein
MEWNNVSTQNYSKTFQVIDSCVTLEQLSVAERYVELFKEQYQVDEIRSAFLDRYLFSKKMKLKNGWNNKN